MSHGNGNSCFLVPALCAACVTPHAAAGYPPSPPSQVTSSADAVRVRRGAQEHLHLHLPPFPLSRIGVLEITHLGEVRRPCRFRASGLLLPSNRTRVPIQAGATFRPSYFGRGRREEGGRCRGVNIECLNQNVFISILLGACVSFSCLLILEPT